MIWKYARHELLLSGKIIILTHAELKPEPIIVFVRAAVAGNQFYSAGCADEIIQSIPKFHKMAAGNVYI